MDFPIFSTNLSVYFVMYKILVDDYFHISNTTESLYVDILKMLEGTECPIYSIVVTLFIYLHDDI